MLNQKKIVVFDFETDGTDTRVCNPVQLAAVVIEPRTLEIIDKSDFNVRLKPPGVEERSYFEANLDCIKWHGKIRGMTAEAVWEDWKTYPSQETGWNQFVDYLTQYRRGASAKGGVTAAPIVSGYNIIGFDLPIVDRLCHKYGQVTPSGEPNLIFRRDCLDLMHQMFWWFENQKWPESYKLDSIRDHIGMSKAGAHDALQDVKDTATIIIKLLKLYRRFSQKVIWNP